MGRTSPASRAPEPWWRNAVIYEIFVRSFQDSNGDGIGDLNGVRERLDYLKALGIDAIWLTPIFKSPSYHGYDAQDYLAINPEYGTLADLDALVADAHKRGIRVLLDLAVNHTSIGSDWFTQSRKGPASPYRDWYLWADRDPGWKNAGSWNADGGAYYYSTFSSSMPDLNWKSEGVREAVAQAAKFWLARGIDGYRLDAARYYVKGPQGQPDTPGTHAVLAMLHDWTRNANPESMLVGEVWADANTIRPYVSDGKELDLAFSFPIAFGLVEALKTGKAKPFSDALAAMSRSVIRRPAPSPATWAPFLTNHDLDRVATQLGGDPASLGLGALVLLTLPGTPFLYAGEEIGLPNGKGATFAGDLAKRAPMIWTSAQGRGFTTPGREPWLPFSTDDPAISVEAQSSRASLLERYRSLIALRKKEPDLRGGDFSPIGTAAPEQLFAYSRGNLVVVANFGAKEQARIQLDVSGAAGGAETIWGKSQVAASSDHLTLDRIGPREAAIVRLTY